MAYGRYVDCDKIEPKPFAPKEERLLPAFSSDLKLCLPALLSNSLGVSFALRKTLIFELFLKGNCRFLFLKVELI
jgi:hypothetical protein